MLRFLPWIRIQSHIFSLLAIPDPDLDLVKSGIVTPLRWTILLALFPIGLGLISVYFWIVVYNHFDFLGRTSDEYSRGFLQFIHTDSVLQSDKNGRYILLISVRLFL